MIPQALTFQRLGLWSKRSHRKKIMMNSNFCNIFIASKYDKSCEWNMIIFAAINFNFVAKIFICKISFFLYQKQEEKKQMNAFIKKCEQMVWSIKINNKFVESLNRELKCLCSCWTESILNWMHNSDGKLTRTQLISGCCGVFHCVMMTVI